VVAGFVEPFVLVVGVVLVAGVVVVVDD